MKLLELFGGIGACTQALKRLHVPLVIVDYVEIDKYAVQSYNAINGTDFKPQDITKWDKDVAVDLIMHGSPCQDFSIAGKQAGADEGSGTRSSLMYETIRIVEKLQPKFVIWENVKNVLSKKHRHNFEAYLSKMASLGYENHYQVLNAKDYGIPQNRERIFCVSVFTGGEFSLDGYDFIFPKKLELKKLLKDVLEDNVDEKYYLSDKAIEKFLKNLDDNKYPFGKAYRVLGSTVGAGQGTNSRHWVYDINGCISYLDATQYKQPKQIIDPKCVQVGSLSGGKWDKMHDISRRVYSEEGLSPSIHTCGGGNTEPKVLVSERQAEIKYKILDNGNIRAYRDDERKSGVSEMQIQNPNNVGATLTTAHVPKVLVGVDNHPLSKKLEFQGFKNKEVCPTLLATDYKAPKCIAIKNATKKGYDEAMEGDSVNLQHPDSETRRGRVGHGVAQTLQTSCTMGVIVDDTMGYDGKPRIYEETAPTLRSGRSGLKVAETICLNSKVDGKQPHVQDRVYDSEGISTAITTAFRPSIAEHTENLRIRKLTPKECWRLMGFSDECFAKAEKVNSNTQLYKQAGNSIVVDVLEHIFRNLLLKQHRLYKKD